MFLSEDKKRAKAGNSNASRMFEGSPLYSDGQMSMTLNHGADLGNWLNGHMMSNRANQKKMSRNSCAKTPTAKPQNIQLVVGRLLTAKATTTRRSRKRRL